MEGYKEFAEWHLKTFCGKKSSSSYGIVFVVQLFLSSLDRGYDRSNLASADEGVGWIPTSNLRFTSRPPAMPVLLVRRVSYKFYLL